MVTRLIVVIISQYALISDQYVVHLMKLKLCCMSIHLNKKLKRKCHSKIKMVYNGKKRLHKTSKCH